MATEGPGREDHPDDSDDIDARFEEIVSGLRAEQAASAQRRRDAIRRAEQQGRASNRPLEGFDSPNTWPPTSGGRSRPATPSQPQGTPDGTNKPWVDPLGTPPRPGPPAGHPGEAPHGSPPRGSPPRGGPPPGGPPHPALGPPQAPAESPDPAWRGWEGSDEEEHFIPPNPPLPAGDLHLWAIVVGLLGGPLMLVFSEIFNVLHGGWWTPLGIGLSVAGVVLLVLRLPKNRDYTDSSGGAQV